MKTWTNVALLTGSLALAVPANAETVNLIKRVTKVEGNCFNNSNSNHLRTIDDNPASVWSVKVSKACHLVYRFDEPVVASQVLVLNAVPNGVKEDQLANRVSVWGSHQSFGSVFYKLGEAALPANRAANIQFSNSLNLRSLKLIVEKAGKGGWPRLSSSRIVSIADIALVGPEDTKPTKHWPQPPIPIFKGLNDPILLGKATRCDELAGHLYNPDSYGYGRFENEIDVPVALRACEIAVANDPKSARLAYNLARVELLGERAPQAISRLNNSLLVGYSPAQHLFAQSFENGTGVAKNPIKARELFQKAAAQDFGPSLNWLAQKSHENRAKKIADGAAKDSDSEVEPYLKQAVELGYLPATRRYFEHVLKHKKVSIKNAYDLLERAAEQGNVEGMSSFLTNLSNGYKIRKRGEDTRHYGLKLSKLNSYEMMTNFSRLRGAANWKYWRRRASYSGSYYAIEHFAKWQGYSEKNQHLPALAFRAAVKGAKDGNHWIMEWLAQYHEAGFGTKKDPKEARVWRCRARAAGNPVALSAHLPLIPGKLYNGTC